MEFIRNKWHLERTQEGAQKCEVFPQSISKLCTDDKHSILWLVYKALSVFPATKDLCIQDAIPYFKWPLGIFHVSDERLKISSMFYTEAVKLGCLFCGYQG